MEKGRGGVIHATSNQVTALGNLDIAAEQDKYTTTARTLYTEQFDRIHVVNSRSNSPSFVQWGS